MALPTKTQWTEVGLFFIYFFKEEEGDLNSQSRNGGGADRTTELPGNRLSTGDKRRAGSWNRGNVRLIGSPSSMIIIDSSSAQNAANNSVEIIFRFPPHSTTQQSASFATDLHHK